MLNKMSVNLTPQESAVSEAGGRKTDAFSFKELGVGWKTTMRSMGHPDYVYRPASPEAREKMSAAHKRRLGIPVGHVRLYGVHFPEEVGREVAAHVCETARLKGYDAAREFALSLAAEMPDWELIGELMAEGTTIEEVATFTRQEPWFIEKMTRRFRRINRKRVTYDRE